MAHSPGVALDSLPDVLTATEVASLLRVSSWSIYERARAGELSGVFRVGRTLRFSKAAIARMLDEDGRDRSAQG